MADIAIKNPNAPATERQLWKLHTLTNKDTRALDITMQQASDLIDKFNEPSQALQTPQKVHTERGMPFQYAHVTFITGEQGSGKSVTAVARVRDAYDKDCVRVYCHDKLGINCMVKWYNRSSRTAKIEHNDRAKLVHIPVNYKMVSSLKIYCNFHLFGMKYTFIPSFDYLAKWLDDGTIRDGYLIIDEYYLGGFSRESMKALTRKLAQLSQQFRKRMLEVIVMCQLARMADWTMRITPTEHISCNYDVSIHKVMLEIRKRGIKGLRKLSFNPRPYFKNYWTNEIVNK